jgi:hypothetical protein
MKYEKYEKNDITIIFKTNGKIDSKNHQMLKLAKEKVFKITNDFRIILLMSEEIDTNQSLKDDEVSIEYYSKPELNETIVGNYLNFLDKFLEIGYEDKINTFPMD